MATETIVRVVDDYTKEVRDDTTEVRLVVDGRLYELDLCPESQAKLMKALEPFIGGVAPTKPSAAHRVNGSKPARLSVADRKQNAEIREWATKARAAGMDLPKFGERGRLPLPVVQAFYAQRRKALPDVPKAPEAPAQPAAPAKPAAKSASQPAKTSKADSNGNGNGDGRYTPAQRRELSGRIRRWATANGYEVNAKGRISAEVVAAFEAANA